MWCNAAALAPWPPNFNALPTPPLCSCWSGLRARTIALGVALGVLRMARLLKLQARLRAVLRGESVTCAVRPSARLRFAVLFALPRGLWFLAAAGGEDSATSGTRCTACGRAVAVLLAGCRGDAGEASCAPCVIAAVQLCDSEGWAVAGACSTITGLG